MALLLLAALTLPPAPDACWQVVIMTDDPGRAPQAEQAARAALEWWRQQGMAVPDVGPAQVAPVPPDALDSPPVFGERTIVILDADGLLLGSKSGLAGPGRVWAVMTSDLAVTLTHELGHALYGLENGEGCQTIDIMCPLTAQTAYLAGFAGCDTLGAIGRPCHTIALPEVLYV